MKTEHKDHLLKCGEIIFTKFSKKLLYYCSYCCGEDTEDNAEKFSTETLLDFIQHISEYHFDKTLGRIDHQINILDESDLNPPNYYPTEKSIENLQGCYQDKPYTCSDNQFIVAQESMNSANDTSIEKYNENSHYQSTNSVSALWPSSTNNENTFEIHEINPHVVKQEIIEFEKEHIHSQSLISVEKPYKCEHCGKYFTQSQNLTVHKRIHTGEKPFVCEICSKTFSHKSNLNVHRKIHYMKKAKKRKDQNKIIKHDLNFDYLENNINSTKKKTKKYECSYCGKYFAQNQNLMVHIRSHTGEKPYNCEFCKKAFSHKSNLTVHLRMHTGEKPFNCKQCNKKFSDKSASIYHRRVHIVEKTFQCSYCKKQFSAKNDLKQHEKKIHFDLKLHKCNECDRSFANSSNLNTHKRIHSGVKPYKCDICEKLFRHNSNLSVHRRIHDSTTKTNRKKTTL